MKISAAKLLESFENLREEAKVEVASEILKRSAKLDLPPLNDDALVGAAESLFQALDKEESQHEHD